MGSSSSDLNMMSKSLIALKGIEPTTGWMTTLSASKNKFLGEKQTYSTNEAQAKIIHANGSAQLLKRATPWIGDKPNMRAYSRLNWDAL